MAPFPSSRSVLAFTHDVVMAAASFVLSLYLRLGDSLFASWPADRLALSTGLFTAIATAVFVSQRMYRGVWRFASVQDLIVLTRAATLAILIFLPAMFLVTRLDTLPRSLLVINWLVLLVLLGGPRFLYRQWRDRRQARRIDAGDERRIPVLLYGTGTMADLFIRACHQQGGQFKVVGLVAEGPSRVGREIHGLPVLGTASSLDAVVAGLKAKGVTPEKLVVTDDETGSVPLRHLFDQADALGMTLARLPHLTDFKDGIADKVEIRPVAVEDLLGRPQAVLDRDAMRALTHGRRVLVTGAGGSIGSELVRQIATSEPASLVLLEASEFALYTIDMEIGRNHPDLARRPVIADIRDARRIGEIMATERPELVFHAAALKHVPLVEENPLEGCLTNAVGTRIVADAASANGVSVMVQISTDKAVNPTNVMGATKRIAEAYCQALDGVRLATRYITVRFGNVLGSTGSVVPLFQSQLAQGGPITVTDPEMTRYFMTIREAVELVLQASALGFANPGRYQGRIFVLDMGEPVKILNLARQMIRLAGLKPDIDVKIVFTGLRPGEKLFEEIFHGAEAPLPTEAPGILEALIRAGDPLLVGEAIAQLETACRANDAAGAMDVLRRLVPEYSGDCGRLAAPAQ